MLFVRRRFAPELGPVEMDALGEDDSDDNDDNHST